MRPLTIFIICTCLIFNASAQQKWNLQSVVEYAMANNISVKLSDVQAKVAAITYRQNQLSKYPDLNFSANESFNAGLNQDPTSFSKTTQTYLNTGLQLQSSVDIFNFYSKRNTIEASKWDLMAAQAATAKTKNDIALNAANAYLQILLSKAQENIAGVQIKQTNDQLVNVRKQVDAGALPELNATQLEAQLALDSLTYLTAKGNTQQAILVLKSYMSMDAAADFPVDIPEIDKIPVEPIASLQPDYVYDLALKNMPQQKYNEFRLKAAEKSSAAARGSMYPTLSAFGSLSSSYIASRQKGFDAVPAGYSPFPQSVLINGNPSLIQSQLFDKVPNDTYIRTGPFYGQLSDNFRQSVGISLSVPIFNRGVLRSNYEKSKLNVTTVQLQKQNDDLQLKQDIYQAYNAALVAYQKFNASSKSVDINELNLSYAQKRFNVGMLGTYDLITTQNNLLRAKLEYVQNQFDYVFKMKVLEFYKGQGLKL